MAKPKSGKKANGANTSIPTNTNTEPVSETNVRPVEASGTFSAPEINQATKKSVPKKATSKPEPRANLVPINLEDEIRQLAYLFSERRGFVPGHEADDWVAAEREVLQRYRQHSA